MHAWLLGCFLCVAVLCVLPLPTEHIWLDGWHQPLLVGTGVRYVVLSLENKRNFTLFQRQASRQCLEISLYLVSVHASTLPHVVPLRALSTLSRWMNGQVDQTHE